MEANNNIKPGGYPLIFPDVKIVVYPAPKAAGSSIKTTLAHSYTPNADNLKDALRKVRRETWHDLKRYPRDETFFKIGFCRDPLEKIRSIYVEKLFKRKTVRPQLVELGFYKHMPFDEYINLVVAIPDDKAEKHLKSQHLLLFRDGPPDLLIRYENLNEDWKKVQKLFKDRGGPPIADLMRLNVSGIDKPRMMLSMKKAVADRYKTDIELLGY